MKVIIAGAGEIGIYVAERVSADGHDVTIIDNDENILRRIAAGLDVHCLPGSAAAADTLKKAGIHDTDLLVALTGSDETNLVAASVAARLGATRTIARVDEVVYRKTPDFSYSQHFGIDQLVSPQMLTALELASVIRNPGALAVEHFAGGRVEMQQFLADRGARFVGKPLHDLELPHGVRLGMICHENQLIIPRGDDLVHHDDLITLIGETEQLAQARAGFETDAPKSQKIVIMGGGHTALSLARRLRGKTFRLTIIESDPARCRLLATLLPHATILNGDGTMLNFLQEERIDNAAAFISTTSSDETNIMSAIQAKNLGVPKVLVVIHRPDYTHLMEKMGIERAVSPRAVMAHEVLALLRKNKAFTLASFEQGQAEILELTVEADTFVGQPLRKINLPPQCLILTFLRRGEVNIPNADTEFQLGDIVLVICKQEQRKKIIKLIVG